MQVLAKWVSVVLSAVLLAACTQEQSVEQADALLLRHVSIIDAGAPEARSGMSILVVDGRIQSVVSDSDIEPDEYPAARVLDLSGRYVVPGLIETHAHLATYPDPDWAEAMLDRYVMAGVTTVRDMAGDTRYLSDLRRRLLTEQLNGPDLHFSALMGGPSFFDDPRTQASAAGEQAGAVPWMQAIAPNTDIVQAVALSRGTGATGIKIYANLPAEDVMRIGVEAERQNMRVWSHGTIAPALPADAVAAGVDVVSHVCMLVSHISPLKPQAYPARPDPDFSVFGDDYSGYADLFEAMRRQGTMIDPNLRLYAEADRRRQANPANPPRMRCPLAYASGIARAAHAAGIDLTVGTDGVAAADAAYPALFDELELLQRSAGLTPHEVLVAATRNGARALGLDSDRGLVTQGYRADLVVLARNPLDGAENFRSVEGVVRAGRWLDRSGWSPRSEALAGD
ncbi:MAG: amidohydrolase family protein [Pseudomonadota bacterium]|nr:amidohydrolase family protein [Pseudomonadota bacterium]